MIQILMLIFGVLAFTRSELKIWRNRVVTGDACKLVGGILLGGAVGGFFLGGLVMFGALLVAILVGLAQSEIIEPEVEKVKN